MTEILASTAAILLGYGGITMLVLGMSRRYQRVCGSSVACPPLLVGRLRLTAAALLVLSLGAAAMAAGPSGGILSWIGTLAGAVLLLGLLLAYRPRWALPVAMAAAGVGLVGQTWAWAWAFGGG